MCSIIKLGDIEIIRERVDGFSFACTAGLRVEGVVRIIDSDAVRVRRYSRVLIIICFNRSFVHQSDSIASFDARDGPNIMDSKREPNGFRVWGWLFLPVLNSLDKRNFIILVLIAGLIYNGRHSRRSR